MNKPKNYPFVEPEVAILADKHHGFAFYEPSDLNYYYNIDLDDGVLYKEEECNDYECYAAAPLYQTLIDWFREEHNYHVSVRCWGTKFYGNIVDIQEKNEMDWDLTEFDSYYEALEEAITKAFILI